MFPFNTVVSSVGPSLYQFLCQVKKAKTADDEGENIEEEEDDEDYDGEEGEEDEEDLDGVGSCVNPAS